MVSLEEITPCQKKRRSCDKRKDKVEPNFWEDVAIALGRAHNVVTLDDLKVISGIPSHKVVNHYIHKLVQVFLVYLYVSLE